MKGLKWIYERAKHWKSYPAYRYEMRVDYLIGMFLADYLNTQYKDKTFADDCVFPEFPFTNRKRRADFLCVSKYGSAVMVEIKTDANTYTKGEAQEKDYRSAGNIRLCKLLSDLDFWAKKEGRYRKKYACLNRDVKAKLRKIQKNEKMKVMYLMVGKKRGTSKKLIYRTYNSFIASLQGLYRQKKYRNKASLFRVLQPFFNVLKNG